MMDIERLNRIRKGAGDRNGMIVACILWKDFDWMINMLDKKSKCVKDLEKMLYLADAIIEELTIENHIVDLNIVEKIRKDIQELIN